MNAEHKIEAIMDLIYDKMNACFDLASSKHLEPRTKEDFRIKAHTYADLLDMVIRIRKA